MEESKPAQESGDEKEGIEAFIYLKALIGIAETQERAREGWQAMSQAERDKTIYWYRLLSSRSKIGA